MKNMNDLIKIVLYRFNRIKRPLFASINRKYYNSLFKAILFSMQEKGLITNFQLHEIIGAWDKKVFDYLSK